MAGRNAKLEDLQRQASAPDFWTSQTRAKDVIGRTNALRAILDPWAEAEKTLGDLRVYMELAEAEDGDAARQAALVETSAQMDRLDAMCGDLEVRALLGGRFDANNCFLTLHAGAGGTESCDWADILFRMYKRFAERSGFQVEVLDAQPGEEAGLKSVNMFVQGPYAYGYFKSERGVHRLVRISPFDSNKRRHTSFAALDVSAEIDEDIEIEIDEKDLRVDTYRAGGAGGQHVNKTDSAIRIVHNPTGIVVACQAERSQHSNRDKAMKMLKARLYELEVDKKRKDMEQFYGEKGDIAWGRQIRSYVLQPYQMVKDHRTDTETGRVDLVLDGDLKLFIDAFLRQGRSTK